MFVEPPVIVIAVLLVAFPIRTLAFPEKVWFLSSTEPTFSPLENWPALDSTTTCPEVFRTVKLDASAHQ